MAISNPFNGERKPGYVGMPLPTVSVRLVSDDGEINSHFKLSKKNVLFNFQCELFN